MSNLLFLPLFQNRYMVSVRFCCSNFYALLYVLISATEIILSIKFTKARLSQNLYLKCFLFLYLFLFPLLSFPIKLPHTQSDFLDSAY